jgi:uncharacterized protein YdhG (YjbR/CyaY superfamily)
MKKNNVTSVDDYIAEQPVEIWEKLNELRQVIKSAAPKADEAISYGMPAYKFQGVLVYFGVFKNHIGFYPTGSGISAFKKELSVYEGSKGTVRFPIDKPLPLTLIKKIVRFRLKENEQKQLLKKRK